jgi:hypothetical protein
MLSEDEREAVSDAWNGSIRDGADPTIAVVEAIVAAHVSAALSDFLAMAETTANGLGIVAPDDPYAKGWNTACDVILHDLRAALTAAEVNS